ncbi:hypothetical protein CUMW_070900 [Citrus unshiu]|nr:hypothetical protein CUMW_070900 [Citrus unshiu]
MLKFLSKVRIEFNALDPRIASCMEFLAQCNAPKAKESNPACQIQVKRRTDDHPPEIKVTFVTGAEEVFDATSTSAHTIRSMILEKGQMLENEQMFRDAGLNWPVLIPDEELQQPMAGIKSRHICHLLPISSPSSLSPLIDCARYWKMELSTFVVSFCRIAKVCKRKERLIVICVLSACLGSLWMANFGNLHSRGKKM